MGIFDFTMLALFELPSAEVLKNAGLNTLMGLAIVFCALGFISLVILLQGKIFIAIDKAKSARKVAPAAPEKEEAPVQESTEDLSDDEELVAVITAAIYAFEAESGAAVPADGLVVRSIRRRR